MAEVKITLKRSLIGRPQDQIRTVKALGLSRPGKSVIKPMNESVKGMVNKVSHLVLVEELDK